MLGVGGQAIADHQVASAARTLALPGVGRLRERAAGVLGVLVVAQRLADRVPLRAQERESTSRRR